MALGLFGGWSSMAGALIEAVVLYLYAVLLLHPLGGDPAASRLSGRTGALLVLGGARRSGPSLAP